MKKILCLCLCLIALGVLWGRETWIVGLDSYLVAPLEINVPGNGIIVIKRDGKEVLRIYSDDRKTTRSVIL